MKVLITGGAGMVGSHAAVFYAERGDEVVVFDNLMRSGLFGYEKKSVEYNWYFLEKYKNIKRVKGDVRNAGDLKGVLVGGVDAVIHAAGQPGVGYSFANPAEDYSINAFGTFNVLEHVRQLSPRAAFIYCSTNKVYGENVNRLPLKELEKRYAFSDAKGIGERFGIDLAAHTPYGVSKYMGDVYAQEYAHSFGIKTGVFRMSCIYGTRQFGFEDQGWLAHFIISNVTRRPVTIYGDGKQVRDVLYVDDLVKAFDMFASSKLKQAVFNIGGGESNTLSLLEFVEKIESRTGIGMRKGFSEWRHSDQKVYVSDIGAVKSALGWHPETGVDAGIDRLIGWVNGNKEFFK